MAMVRPIPTEREQSARRGGTFVRRETPLKVCKDAIGAAWKAAGLPQIIAPCVVNRLFVFAPPGQSHRPIHSIIITGDWVYDEVPALRLCNRSVIDGAALIHDVRPDIDNLDKTLFDALKVCGAVADDGLIFAGSHARIYSLPERLVFQLCPLTVTPETSARAINVQRALRRGFSAALGAAKGSK